MNETFVNIAAILAYFSSVAALVQIVLIFVALDFISGVYASYRTKQNFVSHRLRKTIEKFVFYSISIIIAFMFQLEFASWCNLAQIIAGFIAGTELLSIYENVTKITGLNLKDKVKEYISKILKRNEKL